MMYLMDVFNAALPAASGFSEPNVTTPAETPLNLGFVLNVQRELLRYAADGNRSVSDNVAAATRDVHLRAISQFDSLFSGAFVEGFNRISRFIDMGLHDASNVLNTQSRLKKRLADDLYAHSTFLAVDRIRSVQTAFKSLGIEFSGEHTDDVVDGLYDRFHTSLQLGSNDLSKEVSKIETIVGHMDYCVKNPLSGYRIS